MPISAAIMALVMALQHRLADEECPAVRPVVTVTSDDAPRAAFEHILAANVLSAPVIGADGRWATAARPHPVSARVSNTCMHL